MMDYKFARIADRRGTGSYEVWITAYHKDTGHRHTNEICVFATNSIRLAHDFRNKITDQCRKAWHLKYRWARIDIRYNV
jgi:hypothetical protein